MFEKFTDKARKVMSIAQDEARNLGQMYVGTGHLLLALIKEGEGIAAQALAKLDVTYEETLHTIKELSTEETEPVPGGHIPFTPRAKRVLEGAYRETMTHGQTYIATEHLLLGIVAEGDGRAMTALSRMGVCDGRAARARPLGRRRPQRRQRAHRQEQGHRAGSRRRRHAQRERHVRLPAAQQPGRRLDARDLRPQPHQARHRRQARPGHRP